jgi:hypothetical protein
MKRLGVGAATNAGICAAAVCHSIVPGISRWYSYDPEDKGLTGFRVSVIIFIVESIF